MSTVNEAAHDVLDAWDYPEDNPARMAAAINALRLALAARAPVVGAGPEALTIGWWEAYRTQAEELIANLRGDLAHLQAAHDELSRAVNFSLRFGAEPPRAPVVGAGLVEQIAAFVERLPPRMMTPTWTARAIRGQFIVNPPGSFATPGTADARACEICGHKAHDGGCVALNGRSAPPILCGCGSGLLGTPSAPATPGTGAGRVTQNSAETRPGTGEALREEQFVGEGPFVVLNQAAQRAMIGRCKGEDCQHPHHFFWAHPAPRLPQGPSEAPETTA